MLRPWERDFSTNNVNCVLFLFSAFLSDTPISKCFCFCSAAFNTSKSPKGSLYTIPKVIQNALRWVNVRFEYWGTNAYFTR